MKRLEEDVLYHYLHVVKKNIAPGASLAVSGEYKTIRSSLAEMKKTEVNTFYHEPYSLNPIFGWLVIWIRKVARRVVLKQFCEKPFEQQNKFNQNTTITVQELLKQNMQMKHQIDELENKINDLSTMLTQYSNTDK